MRFPKGGIEKKAYPLAGDVEVAHEVVSISRSGMDVARLGQLYHWFYYPYNDH